MGKAVKSVVISVAMFAAVVGVTALTGGIGLAAAFAAAGGLTTAAVMVGTTLLGTLLAPSGPKVPRSQLSRLNISLDPSTPRKAVFGTTAMNPDLRYHEASGADQEYIDYIIAVAAHKVASIDEIWFEEKKAWDASTGVTSTYSGYLTVAVREEGTAANTISINGGSKWGSTRRLTGCAYVHLRIKRTGNSKKSESPLASGLPSRVTIIGEGALLYDPRLDSTVSGGSGSHRADDQSTWGSYTAADDTDNPALQLLWWLLGWKINGQLSIGCGVPPERIDLPSFIAAANICDENVTLAIGGTQKRYRTSGTASDADDRLDVINTFLACMNGTLRDSNGKLSVTVLKNDLADYVLDFDDDDILGDFEWNQTRGLSTSYNVVRGRFIDPSQNSLYQLVDYPEVSLTSPDGIERVMTMELPFVEDGRRAQRIAKQALQRNQYRGSFSATFKAKALGCEVGDVVRVSFETLGWSNKLFRIVSKEVRFDGQVPLTMVEENAAIYAWDAEDVAPVTATAPTVYDPLNSPFILADALAQETAEGKVTTFVSETEPTADGEGDLWFKESTGELRRWDGAAWGDALVDLTSAQQVVIAPPPAQIVYRDYLGEPKSGQFNRTLTPTITRGGTSIRTDNATSYSITTSGVTATVNNTNGSADKGRITVTDGGAGNIGLTVTVSGVTYGPFTIPFTVVDDAPPSSGGGGAGGGTDSTLADVTSTSFAAMTKVDAGESDFEVTISGTGDTINGTAPLTYEWTINSGSGSNALVAKWQYKELPSGSWTDFGSALTGTAASYDADEFYLTPGSLNVNQTVTGLTAGDYAVRMVGKKNTSDGNDIYVTTGTATVSVT